MIGFNIENIFTLPYTHEFEASPKYGQLTLIASAYDEDRDRDPSIADRILNFKLYRDGILIFEEEGSGVVGGSPRFD